MSLAHFTLKFIAHSAAIYWPPGLLYLGLAEHIPCDNHSQPKHIGGVGQIVFFWEAVREVCIFATQLSSTGYIIFIQDNFALKSWGGGGGKPYYAPPPILPKGCMPPWSDITELLYTEIVYFCRVCFD